MRTDMRRIMSSIILGGALCGGAAARAQEAGANFGPYVSIAGGINDPKSMNFAQRNPLTAAPANRTANYDTGYNFNGAFGTKWTNGIRTELEVSYRKSGVDNISGTTVDGSQKTLGVMGNALYDFDTGSRINFSVGGGVGVGRAKWDNVRGAGLPTFNDHDTNLQWQAIGEVGLPIGHQMALFADYRYITLYDNNFISTTGTTRASAGTDRSHNILVGLRYYFNS
jgi:opacity protein-like surface antigen